MRKSTMIFRCRNDGCCKEIDPDKNKYCDDCAKKCSEYFCSYGHYFNREQVKDWMGNNAFPKSQAVCPFCHPNGFMKKEAFNKWINVNKKLPSELTHVVCYCPGINGQIRGRLWMDSDYCIGEHINGIWKRVDNENIAVSHWMPIPDPPSQ